MARNRLRYACAIAVTAFVIIGSVTVLAQDKRERTGASAPIAGIEARVIQLEHADLEQVARLVRALFAEPENRKKVTWYAPTNSILLRASSDEIEQMAFLVDQLDQPESEDQEQSQVRPKPKDQLVRLKHAKARGVVNVLTATIRSGRRRGSQSILITYDERTNTIVLRGMDSEIARCKELIGALDIAVDSPNERGED